MSGASIGAGLSLRLTDRNVDIDFAMTHGHGYNAHFPKCKGKWAIQRIGNDLLRVPHWLAHLPTCPPADLLIYSSGME